MTSSLVGSEMCIRDSHCALHDCPGRDERALPARRHARPYVYRSEPQRRPVSYTHLTLPTICSV
eukprot:6108683-Prorocentrum_lima.AAC.1